MIYFDNPPVLSVWQLVGLIVHVNIAGSQICICFIYWLIYYSEGEGKKASRILAECFLYILERSLVSYDWYLNYKVKNVQSYDLYLNFL